MAERIEREVATRRRSQVVDVTGMLREAVKGRGDGLVVAFVPHTTAGITINENADPDVVTDSLEQLDVIAPWSQPFYRHAEGNTAAHVKASMMGSSVTVLFSDGRLELGQWQGVWFCEFDGPRTRRLWIRVIEG